MNEPLTHDSHRADCFDILPTIADGTVDFVFADLPYGTTQNKWDTPIDLPRLWAQLYRVCKRNAAMVFTCQQPFTTTLIASNMKDFRYEWIWEKPNATGHLNANRMPMKAHENLAVFYRKLPTYNPQKTAGHKSSSRTASQVATTNYGAYKQTGTPSDETRHPRTVQIFTETWQRAGKRHPTQKPLALVEYMVKTYTNPGELVLDPTAGVLTTRVASMNTGRSSIVIELDQEYFDRGMLREA